MRKVVTNADLKKAFGLKGFFGTCVAGLAYGVLGLGKINRLFDGAADYQGPAFADHLLENMGITIDISPEQLENIPKEGGFVVVSNPSANSMGTAAAVDTDGNVSVTGGTIIALGTVPGSSGGGPGGKGPGRPGGGRFGMGGMGSGSLLPAGHVTFSGTLEAGEHEFAFGDISAKFSLKNRVTGGWIWSEGITPDGFTLR